MAFAPAAIAHNAILGAFVEKDHGKTFEYVAAQNCPAGWEEYNTMIFVGPDQMTRFAKVLKTVAYVVVGEDWDGSPIVEKWDIRRKWSRD